MHFTFKIEIPNTGSRINIKTIEVLDEEQYELTYTDFESSNRMIDRYGACKFACLIFAPNLSPQRVYSLINGPIYINNEQFSFLGCSSSGLKTRKCYLWKGTPNEASAILRENGDFERINSVSKRLARIGLLFSGCELTCEINPKMVHIVEDIFTADGKYNFTDGCCFIGEHLLKDILAASSLKLAYLPSIIQFRYQGCKGIALLNRSIAPDTLVLRPSLIKFESTVHSRFGLVGVSGPYTMGKLNRQYISLLSGSGIKDEVFARLQWDHYTLLNNMFSNADAAAEVLATEGYLDHAIPTPIDLSSPVVLKRLHEVKRRSLLDPEKLRLMVVQSRNLYGVADRLHVLQYGEVFVRITVRGDLKTLRGYVVVGKNPCYLTGDLRVLKCVDSSDYPALRELERDCVDCLVFPVTGPRPHSNEIAGSDLDGDQYFVSWDSDLIPPVSGRGVPYTYPEAAARKQHGAITQAHLLQYFSEQSQALVGRIDTYYRAWADMQGVNCMECQRLGQLFAKAIDAAKSGEKLCMPKALIPPPPSLPAELVERTSTEAEVPRPCGAAATFSIIAGATDAVVAHMTAADSATATEGATHRYVWLAMIDEAKRQKAAMHEQTISTANSSSGSGSGDIQDVSIDFVYDLLADHDSRLSEFAIFEFCVKWMQRQLASIVIERLRTAMIDSIDFGRFTIDQQQYAVEVAGFDRSIVMNALFKSRLLSPYEINKIEACCSNQPWRLWMRTRDPSADWSYLMKAITTQQEVLILLDAGNGVVVGLHFLRRCRFGVHPVRDTQSFLFSRQFNYIFRYVIPGDYSMDVDYEQQVLQIYQGEKRNSFLWLSSDLAKKKQQHQGASQMTASGVVTSEYTDTGLSVDLARWKKDILRDRNRPHPLVNKRRIQAVEIFVHSADSRWNYFDSYFGLLYEVEEGGADAADPALLSDSDGVETVEQAMLRWEAALCSSSGEDSGPATECWWQDEVGGETFVSFCRWLDTTHADLGSPSGAQQVASEATTEPAVLNSHRLRTLISMTKQVKCLFSCQYPLPQAVYSAIEAAVATAMSCIVSTVPDVLNLAVVLVEVDMKSLAATIINAFIAKNQTVSHILTTSTCLEVISNWRYWLCFDNELSEKVLLWLITQRKQQIVATTSLTESHHEIYLLRMATLSAVSFMHESTEMKEALQVVIAAAETLPLPTSSHSRPLKSFADLFQSQCQLPQQHQNERHRLQHQQQQQQPIRAIKALLLESINEQAAGSKKKMKTVAASFYSTAPQQYRDLTLGMWVALSRQWDQQHTPALSSCTCFGKVVQFNLAPFHITVELDCSDVPYPLHRCLTGSRKWHWQLNPVGNITLYQRTLEACSRILAQPEVACPLLDLISYPSDSGDKTASELAFQQKLQLCVTNISMSSQQPDTKDSLNSSGDNDLNPKQIAAVNGALSQRLTLICGPPGTGKTAVACSYAIQMLQLMNPAEQQQQLKEQCRGASQQQPPSSRQILIVAETNTAVDDIARKLASSSSLRVLRVGSDATVAPDLYPYTMEGQLEKCALSTNAAEGNIKKRRGFQDELGVLHRNQAVCKRIFNAAEVICSTLAGCGEALMKVHTFSCVLMDEATLATEPSVDLAK